MIIFARFFGRYILKLPYRYGIMLIEQLTLELESLIMVKYKFKYWFEWGCSEDWCPCLWAADDVTGEKYGYSINLDELPISKELIHFCVN